MGGLFERSLTVPATLEALRVRHGLLEHLSQLQRSISHGAPLQEVFASIAAGASELLGDPVSGLRLVDEHDPTTMRLVAATGLTAEQLDLVRLGVVGDGAGGRAIVENRVVLVEDYGDTVEGIARFGEFGVQSAIAAPVRVNGRVVGSLTVATFEPGRRYDLVEQEILMALAEHAGLALMDASLIDERERSAHREGEERFQALVRHASDLIAIVDPEGRLLFATPSVARALGIDDVSVLVGTSLLAHLHPVDRSRAGRLLAAAATAPGKQPAADWRLVPAGAQFEPRRWMHVEVIATNLLDHPSVGGIVLNARDVTERVIAEERRREQDALYRLIVDTTHDGVWMTDGNDRTIFVNGALARMLGRTPDELAGRRPADFAADGQVGVIDAAWGRRLRGESDRYEVVMTGADGEPLRMAISATPIFEEGSFVGSLALCADITELTAARDEKARFEDRLRQAQSLETLGSMAGHVAHDFNQVLAVVQGYTDLLRERLAEGSGGDELARIAEAADHGAALARQLVTFSRRDAGEPEVLSIAAELRSTVALVTSTAPPGVTVAARADHDLLVRIDRTKLRQVLMNLVSNAFDALREEGGTLELRLRPVERLGPVRELQPGRYVELVVADTGPGMPDHVLARALEPAFTTKTSGTGLGLAIVQRAVQAAGGTIALRSGPGGTRVTVLLPRADAEPEAPPADEAPPPATVSGTATILLVEDDAAVLEVTRRLLEAHGFSVRACPSPAAAMEVARREPIDLLITDQTMPGSSGIELAAHIERLQPGTPAIVMSGYAPETSPGSCDGVAWLRKPFGSAALMHSVRDALGSA